MQPTLYHNALSTCAQKARLALAEKAVGFRGIELDLMAGEQRDPEYLKLNPNGVVPTLVHEQGVIVESTVINEFIDEVYPGTPLRPGTAADRARMRVWTKRVDEVLHPHVVTFSFGIAFRQGLLKRPPAERDAFVGEIRGAAKRAHMRELIEEGIRGAAFPVAVADVDALLGDLEASLQERPWLGGADFSLADIAVTPYVTRLEQLGLADWWADKPALQDWSQRVRARPSYRTAVLDWMPAKVVEGMGRAGAEAWPAIRQLVRG